MSNKAEYKKMTLESKLAPKLRFREFIKAGEWEKKKLGHFTVLLSEKAGQNKYTLMSITAGIGLVTQLEKFGKEIAGTQYKNYLVIRKNDFAYNKSSTKEYPEGFIDLYSGEEDAAVPNSIFTCFRVIDDTVLPKYLKYLFLANLHGKWLRKFLTVGARAHGSLNIDNNDLLATPVPLPPSSSSLREQEKIAEFLSCFEEIISLQGQKLDALKVYKKSLMQQLFPQEGEAVPSLRFPEFRDTENWQKRKLNEFLVEKKQRNRQLQYGPDAVLSVSGEYGCVNQIKFKGRSYAGASVKDYHVVETGDLVYTKSPLKRNPYGIIKENKGETGIVSTLYAVYRVTSQGHASYLDQYFSRDSHLNNYLQPIVRKGAKNDMKVNNEDVLSGDIWSPEIEEQRRIADCLSSLDELIGFQGQKLDALKAYKKGLLQQLFPVMDEVEA